MVEPVEREAELPTVAEGVARWAACAAVSVPLLGATTLAGPLSSRINHALFRTWGRAVPRLLGIDVELEDRNHGRYDEPPYLFVLLNQASILEVCYWMHAVPFEFGAILNMEFAVLPLLGWATWAHGGIPIVRQWAWHAHRGIAKAEQMLRGGKAMVISIEGRRSTDGALSPYKKGPVVMALRSGATIVPVVFHGARARLPVGQWRVRPGRVGVTLCPSIPVRGLTYEDRDALVARLRELAERELGFAP